MPRSNIVVWLLVVAQLVSTVCSSVALAQTNSANAEKFPVIAHDADRALSTDKYTFTIDVNESSTIDKATFLYRFSNETEFRELNMQLGADGKTYSAQLPKIDQREGIIKYYFVVNNIQGNTITTGYIFDPYTRILSVDSDNAVASNTPSSDNATFKPIKSSGKTKKTLYILLGVLALGAAASAAAGSGSDGGEGSGGGTGCPTGGCTVNLTIPPPATN